MRLTATFILASYCVCFSIRTFDMIFCICTQHRSIYSVLKAAERVPHHKKFYKITGTYAKIVCEDRKKVNDE